VNEEPRIRVTTYAVIVRDGSVLLTRLSEASPVFPPGVWHLPGGGMDPGEQPCDALSRELAEEAGLPVLNAQLLDARSYLAERNDIRWNVISLLYGARVGDGEPRVVEVNGSSDAIEWVPVEEAKSRPLSPPARDGLQLMEKIAW